MPSYSSQPEIKPRKKRAGRTRLPPLPPGPKLRFVIGNCPDDFRTPGTMRNVRSHVMYTASAHRAVSPSISVKSLDRPASRRQDVRTPSPTMTSISDGIIEDSNYMLTPEHSYNDVEDVVGLYQPTLQSTQDGSLRNIASRIIATITAEPARSAPAALDYGSEFPFSTTDSLMKHESLDDLRKLYIYQADPVFTHDAAWIDTICSNHMSFLSHVSMICTYQDLTEGYIGDTTLTQYAKSKILSMITDTMRTRQAQTDDFTILSILHLLICEIGGDDERVIDVHQEGLLRILHERGGLSNLGLDGAIATFLTVIILNLTILRGLSEPTMLREFVPARFNAHPRPISPLYAPHGDLTPLYGRCSKITHDIISDMYHLTRIFVVRWDYTSDTFTTITQQQLEAWDAYMEQTLSKLRQLPSSANDATPDWIYESCRLAALIHCGGIVQGMSLAEASAENMHDQHQESGIEPTDVLTALYNAIRQTDLNSCWGNMNGVLLWVCLVGGRAAWPGMAWARRFFALHAVRASFAISRRHSEAVVEAQRHMLRVQALVDVRRRLSSQFA